MKLHLTAADGKNLFTGYGAGYVALNNVRHEKHLVVMPDRIMEWRVESFEALVAADFEFLLALKPEIVILGTGALQRFPAPALSRPLALAGIGVEVMATQAACRTYNILMAENRKVLAAILIA